MASTSKISPVSMDRNIAQVRVPAATTGEADNKIDISTYITRAGDAQILYNGDRMWCKVTLLLETGGPVAVGQMSNLTPVLSGKGQLLQTGIPAVFNIAKGNRLYIAATGVNRVSVTVEAYPWLETLTGLLTRMAGIAAAPAKAIMAAISTGKAG